MIQPGLVSITFRDLTIQEIVDLCVKADLKAIEWGGDVHCPHGDLEKAKEAKMACEAAGIKVAAYGSYYRLGESKETLAFETVLESAIAMGAPYIRVWAGKGASEDASEAYWKRVVGNLKEIADRAAEANIGITLEYHENTLTDSIDAADRLLSETAHRNVYVNWQPTNYQPFEYSYHALDAVLPYVSNLHVFRWNYDGRVKVRRPLEEGRGDWSRYFEKAKGLKGDRFALLEFVKDDAPAQLLEDAAALNELLEEVNN